MHFDRTRVHADSGKTAQSDGRELLLKMLVEALDRMVKLSPTVPSLAARSTFLL